MALLVSLSAMQCWPASELGIGLPAVAQDPVPQCDKGVLFLRAQQQLVEASCKLLQLCVCAGSACQQPLHRSNAGDLVRGAVDGQYWQAQLLLLVLNVLEAFQDLVGCPRPQVPHKVQGVLSKVRHLQCKICCQLDNFLLRMTASSMTSAMIQAFTA